MQNKLIRSTSDKLKPEYSSISMKEKLGQTMQTKNLTRPSSAYFLLKPAPVCSNLKKKKMRNIGILGVFLSIK